MFAGELQIGANVRVARGPGFSEAIGGDGATKLAGFEVGVAQVEMKGGCVVAGREDLAVGGNGVGKFVLVIEFVRGFEGGGGGGGMKFGNERRSTGEECLSREIVSTLNGSKDFRWPA